MFLLEVAALGIEGEEVAGERYLERTGIAFAILVIVLHREGTLDHDAADAGAYTDVVEGGTLVLGTLVVHVYRSPDGEACRSRHALYKAHLGLDVETNLGLLALTAGSHAELVEADVEACDVEAILDLGIQFVGILLLVLLFLIASLVVLVAGLLVVVSSLLVVAGLVVLVSCLLVVGLGRASLAAT